MDEVVIIAVFLINLCMIAPEYTTHRFTIGAGP